MVLTEANGVSSPHDPHRPPAQQFVSVLCWFVPAEDQINLVSSRQWPLTLVQQLLSEGGLFALRLKESVDALPDQILPARSSRGSQSTCFYGDDLPWSGTPHVHEHTARRRSCQGQRYTTIIPSRAINRVTPESPRYLLGPVL